METTHINVWQHIARVTPLFWAQLALAVAVAAGEIVLWAIAGRRRAATGAAGHAPDAQRRQAVWLAIAAAAGPVLVGAAAVAATRIGHEKVLAGIAARDPGDAFTLIVAGLEAFMNAKPLGLMLLGPIVLLAAVAASLQASLALKVPARPLVQVSVLFAGAGLGPFIGGAWFYAVHTIRLLANVAGIDPEMKAFMITRGLEEERVRLDGGAIAGTVGFVVALVVGIVVAAKNGAHPSQRRGGWAAPVACLIAAVALYFVAEPLRAENTAPWPASPCAALTLNRVATPDVDGPDPIPPRAEVVTVSDTLLLGGGVPRSMTELHDSLVVMRNNYRLLHPGELDDESLVVVCPPETATARLVEVLRLAKAIEYRRPAFAFGKEMVIERPTMGKQRRWRWTAAKALIPGVGPETPTPIVTLRLADHPTCDSVARAVAAARRAGKVPGLAF